MGPSDRPLRGHRAPILISLGIRPNPKSLRDFLVHRFKRIDVLASVLQRRSASQGGAPGSGVTPLNTVPRPPDQRPAVG